MTPVRVHYMLNTAKIRSLREKKGMTVQQAAEGAGWKHRQQWQQIESGDVTNISLATLYAIAKTLKVKPASLLK